MTELLNPKPSEVLLPLRKTALFFFLVCLGHMGGFIGLVALCALLMDKVLQYVRSLNIAPQIIPQMKYRKIYRFRFLRWSARFFSQLLRNARGEALALIRVGVGVWVYWVTGRLGRGPRAI